MSVRKIVALALVILLTGAAGFIAFHGIQVGIYDLGPFYNVVPRGGNLSGGMGGIYEAADLSSETLDADVEAARAIMLERLSIQGLTDATVSAQGEGRLRVDMPLDSTLMEGNPAALIQEVAATANIEFLGTDNAVLFGSEGIEQAYVASNPDTTKTTPVVYMILNEEATAKLAAASTVAAVTGGSLTVTFDGETLTQITTSEPITGGAMYIESADYTAAVQLASQMRTGPLPIELTQVSLIYADAAVTDQALGTAVIAGLCGLLLVLIFMVVRYRAAGLAGGLSIIIFTILYLICLATIQGVVFTLPSILGIILAVGLVVNAHTVVFERLREEIRAGKSLNTAVKTAFQRASSTIIEQNVLIAVIAIALVIFGSGMLESFALALLIGVIVSFLTAMLITRGLLYLMIGFRFRNAASFCPAKKEEAPVQETPRRNYYGRFKYAIILSALVIVAGLAMGLVTGVNTGIDYKGGTLVTVDVGQADFDVNVVEDALGASGLSGARVVRAGNAAGRYTLAEIRVAGSGISDAQSEAVLARISETYPDAEITSSGAVDSTASMDIITNAIYSILIVLALVFAFTWFRFKVLSGCAALIVLLHDLLMMAALVCVCRIQVSSPIIAAFFMAAGYSISNIIGIFGRIRENRKEDAADKNMPAVMNASISGSMACTLITACALILIAGLMCIFGTLPIRNAGLPAVVGLLVGTYSSIFIAAPLWGRLQLARAKQTTPAKKTKGK